MFADHILFLCISTLPEETVILHTDFPQPLGRSMILELESHGALKLLCLLLINRRKNILKKEEEAFKNETVCCASLAVGVQTSPGLILM